MYVPSEPGPNNYLKVADVIDLNAPIKRDTGQVYCISPLQRFRLHYKRLRKEHREAIGTALKTAK